MSTLAIFFIGLTIFSCYTTGLKNDTSLAETIQKSEPNYKVAIQFINDYLDYYNDIKSEIRLIDWINKRSDVTTEFKSELKRMLDEAEQIDPEYGLGFDPIIDAQDSPNKFEMDEIDSDYLVVRGVDWSEFRLIMKLKYEGDKWLVDGSGVINIPEDKQKK